MRSSPERPCDDVSGLDAALGEADRDAADLLDRPADQGNLRALRLLFGGGAAFARCRMVAITAKVSMTSET